MRILNAGAALVVVAGVLSFGLYLSSYAGPARAAVGPGFVDSFHVSCATTATIIRAPQGSQFSYDCMVDDAAGADVFIGDSAVTTSTYGGAYGAGEHFGGDVRKEYCIVASGTITAHCRAMISADPD